jgi:TP53 regulating kinase-like protein
MAECTPTPPTTTPEGEGEVPPCLLSQGAEARVYKVPFPLFPEDGGGGGGGGGDASMSPTRRQWAVAKQRFPKAYRHPSLDATLTRARTITEARVMVRLRRAGIDTPTLYQVHVASGCLYMEWIPGPSVKEVLRNAHAHYPDPGEREVALDRVAGQIGEVLGRMHAAHIIHGDLTTSNMLLRQPSGSLVLIDFGLSFTGSLVEDKAVDLYVLERALLSTHPNTQALFDRILQAYATAYPEGGRTILPKWRQVRKRGRKRAAEA